MEESERGVNERVWREGKEWRDDAIISSKKKRNNSSERRVQILTKHRNS